MRASLRAAIRGCVRTLLLAGVCSVVGCGGGGSVKFSDAASVLGGKLETSLAESNTSELHGALMRAEEMERERTITANDLRIVRAIQRSGSENNWALAKKILGDAMGKEIK